MANNLYGCDSMSVTDGLIIILIFILSAWFFFYIVCRVQYNLYSKRYDKMRKEGFSKSVRNGDLRKAVRKEKREASLKRYEEALERFREEIEKL